MKYPSRLVITLLTLSAFIPLRAQTAPAAPVPPPESHQFDFWIGEWEVYGPQGRLVGHNKIEVVSGGFALLENWSAVGGNSGKSINNYKRATKQWQQYWVGSGGITTEYKGGLVDGKMVLVAEQLVPNRTSYFVRCTWTPNADGSVLQQFENSNDGGKTWTAGFAGLYKHPQKAP